MKLLKWWKHILTVLGIGAVGFVGASTVTNTNREISHSTQTLTVTTSTIATITSNPTSTVHLVANIVANNPTSTDGGGWFCTADFKQKLGTVTVINQACSGGGTLTTWGVGFATTTNGVLVNVNGATSSIINWQAFISSYQL